jgi:gluconate 2-dehydrogenase gamma chain
MFMATPTISRARTISGALPEGPESPNWPERIRLGPWEFFTADEASMVEAIVDRLIPPDDRGPGGKDAGCAVFIDRQLAGPYGRAAGLYMQPPFLPGVKTQGYQMQDSPAQRYRTGLKAIDVYVKATFSGKTYGELPSAKQDEVLSDLEKGSIELAGMKGTDFFNLLLANAMEGFFADPIYGGNRDMVGWKLIGFPGARYDYRDWVEKHNEPYPLPPVGIMGRSDWNTRG